MDFSLHGILIKTKTLDWNFVTAPYIQNKHPTDKGGCCLP